MKKHHLIILLTFSLFCVLSLFVGKMYEIGQNKPPLKFAEINLNTIKTIKESIDEGGHNVGISISNDDGPYDWSNDDDPGAKSDIWNKVEDANFIIYYKKKYGPRWENYAQNTLIEANNCIPELAQLMGKYVYPQDVNNRKLAIYITNSQKDFDEMLSTLMERPTPSGSMIGVTITSIGRTGCRTEGIILHPSTYDANNYEGNQYPSVLLHEMHHYVYRSLMDYSKEVSTYNWQIEGLATYCENKRLGKFREIQDLEAIRTKCKLTEQFPNIGTIEYWGGCSFFRFFAKKYGQEKLHQLIEGSYTNRMEQVFASLNLDPEQLHDEWYKDLLKEMGLDTLDNAVEPQN